MEKLKIRILNRGDIIHKRLETEKLNLKKLQNQLNRKADTNITTEQQKKNEQDIKDAEFRVKILDSRAYKFQMNSLRKYTLMDQKLNKDLQIEQGDHE